MQKLTLNFITMGASKSTLKIFETPSCACISGSLHMTTHTTVLVETFKDLSSELYWCYCNIFSTQDHTTAVITHDGSAAFPPGRVRVLRSYGNSSWIPWYRRGIVVRVTVLIRLLMMGMTWIISYTRVRRRRTCYSRMSLYLTPDPRTMLISIFSKPSSSAN